MYKLLREVNNARVEFALFRGCLAYNKINHLLRTCPPDLLQDAFVKFDDQFQSVVAEILHVPCLSDDQWDQASLPVKLSGLGVNQTKVIASSAYIGSCALTKDLVAALLGVDAELLLEWLNCSLPMKWPLVNYTLCHPCQARSRPNRSFLLSVIKLCLSA